MKTFDKQGDQGETSLLYGERISKSDRRAEAFGAIDEAVSALGLARALATEGRVRATVLHFQNQLFLIGAEMATTLEHRDKLAQHFEVIGMQHVDRIEEMITKLENEMEMPTSFVIPGATPAAAALDVARTAIRRCERRAVALQTQGLVHNEAILAYLNRLADLMFTLARYEEQEHPVPASVESVGPGWQSPWRAPERL
jgi:cob(I)alamin adenosyltransferase